MTTRSPSRLEGASRPLAYRTATCTARTGDSTSPVELAPAVRIAGAHAAMTRELVAGHTLVYTWRGTDLSLPPVVLMAHHDVVSVTSEHPLRPA